MREHPSRELPGPARFVVLTLILIGLVGLAFLLWRASDLLILVFGSIVVATALRSAARVVAAYAKVGEGWSFAIAVCLIVTSIALVLWLVGGRVADQIDQLSAQLPQAWSEVQRWLEQHRLGRVSVEAIRNATSSSAAPRIAGFAATAFGGLADALVLMVLAILIGANPGMYRRGFLCLVPPKAQGRVAGALDASSIALRQWLLGKALSMVSIGILTGLGLWLLGVPMALTLGVLAGFLEFVPFLGPIMAAVPAVLVAFLQSPTLAIYTLLFFFVLQNVEGYAVEPLVQRWAVSLPPALSVVAVLLFGLLFGILGVIFATPLMVVTLALVRKLYVQGALGHS